MPSSTPKASHLRRVSDRIFRVTTRNSAGERTIHAVLTFAEDLGGDELHVGWRCVSVAGEDLSVGLTYGEWYLPKPGVSLEQVWARRGWGPIAIEDTGRRLAEPERLAAK